MSDIKKAMAAVNDMNEQHGVMLGGNKKYTEVHKGTEILQKKTSEQNNTEIENWISKYRYETLKKEALDIVYKNRINNWQSRAEHFGNGYAEDFTYLYGLDIDKIMGGAKKGGLHLKVEDGVVKPDQKGKNSISDKKRTLFYRQISTFHNTVNVEGKDNSTRIRNIPHYANNIIHRVLLE